MCAAVGLPHHPAAHLERQIPVLRCGMGRRMTSDMTLPSAEVRHQRFAKNRDIATSLATPGLSCARAEKWAGCVKGSVGKWLLRAPLTVPLLLLRMMPVYQAAPGAFGRAGVTG